jgi:hypothetical protein
MPADGCAEWWASGVAQARDEAESCGVNDRPGRDAHTAPEGRDASACSSCWAYMRPASPKRLPVFFPLIARPRRHAAQANEWAWRSSLIPLRGGSNSEPARSGQIRFVRASSARRLRP